MNRRAGTRASVADDLLLQRLLHSAGRDGDSTRLPSERELTTLLEVSRPTVRDRLSLLEGIGAIERRTGSGTFLRPLDPADLAGILQLAALVGTFSEDGLTALLIAVEAEAAALAAQRRAAAELLALIADYDVEPDVDSLARFDTGFRAAMVRASGDDGIVFFHTALTLLFDRSPDERLNRGRTLADDPDWTRAEYWTLSAAIATGDTATATAVARRHARWLTELGRLPADFELVARAD